MRRPSLTEAHRIYWLGLLHSTSYFCGVLSLAIHLVGLGWEEWAAGVALGVTQALSGLAAVLAGPVVDRLGSRRVLWWALSVSALAQVALGAFALPSAAVAGWMVVSCGNAIFLTAATHRLNDLRGETGSPVFPYFYVALSLGGILAPLVSSGILQAFDSTRPVFFTAGAVLAISVLSMVGMPRDRVHAPPPRDPAGPAPGLADVDLPASSWVMVGAAVTVMGATGLIGFFYLYTDQLGISLGTAGLVLTVGQIGLFLPRLFARLVDRATNDAGMVLFGVLVAGIGVVVLGFGTLLLPIGIGVFLAGVGRGAVQPATASIVSSIVPPHVAGRFLGIRAGAMQLAGGAGSLLFGVSASLRQIDLAFLFAGVLALVVTAGATLTTIPRRVRFGSRRPRLETSTPRADASGRQPIGADDDLSH